MKHLHTIFISCYLIFATFATQAQSPQDHVVREKPISISILNPSSLGTPQNPESQTNGFSLSLFGGTTIKLTQTRVEQRSAEDFSWFGKVNGSPESTAIFVVKNGNITGHLEFEGNYYEINPTVGNAHTISEIDLTKLPLSEEDVVKPTQDESHIASPQSNLGFNPNTNNSAAIFNGVAETIDVLVVYSNQAAANYTDIGARAQLAIDYTNQAYENSQIPHRVNLVGVVPVDYDERGSSKAEVFAYQDKFDGRLDDVHALKQEFQADIVSIWVNHITNLCGQAASILARGNSSAVHVMRTHCGGRTFAHELGHNQGARHNTENDPDDEPFPYGHGAGSPTNQWRTIMSYDSACSTDCATVQYFSNPNIFINDEPLGDSEVRDNARVITETASDIAMFSEQFNPIQAESVILVSEDGSIEIALEKTDPGRWMGSGTLQPGTFYNFFLMIDGVQHGSDRPIVSLGDNFGGYTTPGSNNSLFLRTESSPEALIKFDELSKYAQLITQPASLPNLYLRGTANNFELTPMTHIGFNRWRAEMTFTGEPNQRFKFDAFGDWTQNYGVDSETGRIAEGGEDIFTDRIGTYRVYVDLGSARDYWFERMSDTTNLAPTADSGPDFTVAVGEAFNLDASASFDSDGSIVEYLWSNGLTGVSPSMQIDEPGMVTLTLTVQDNSGATSTDTITITAQEENNQWQRTLVFIFGETQPGQDMFIRGGIDHGFAEANLNRACTAENKACAIPIRHLNLRNNTTALWKQNDEYLDWYGLEPNQAAGEGTPLDWTTNQWDADWGPIKTYEVDGSGETPLNTYGLHYWLLEAEMDCSTTVDGWFELKSFISGGPGWEPDVNQENTPWESGNHFAQCGMKNVFSRGVSAPIEIVPIQ